MARDLNGAWLALGAAVVAVGAGAVMGGKGSRAKPPPRLGEALMVVPSFASFDRRLDDFRDSHSARAEEAVRGVLRTAGARGYGYSHLIASGQRGEPEMAGVSFYVDFTPAVHDALDALVAKGYLVDEDHKGGFSVIHPASAHMVDHATRRA